eukprot:COSAG01_NODE_15595_length_1320_cov_56.696151_1_plen_65_part_10
MSRPILTDRQDILVGQYRLVGYHGYHTDRRVYTVPIRARAQPNATQALSFARPITTSYNDVVYYM